MAEDGKTEVEDGLKDKKSYAGIPEADFVVIPEHTYTMREFCFSFRMMFITCTQGVSGDAGESFTAHVWSISSGFTRAENWERKFRWFLGWDKEFLMVLEQGGFVFLFVKDVRAA